MKNTKKKVLFVATVDSHIELFHLPYLKMFKDKGYEVHVATNTDKKIQYCDKKHKISIARSPFRLCNLKAIRQLKKIVNEEHFDIIHCHTPMGGVVARLAAKKARKNGTRMIYTAHGFHFYKGAPLKNWLLFYPVEKYLAKYTDTLITINNEDFERAKKKFGKRCRDIEYVPGVGVDEKKFKRKLTKEEKHNLRKSLGLKDDDFVMIFPAELSKRKNQMWLIKTLKPVFDEDKKKHLLLPGKDSLNGKCQKLTKKLGLEDQVHFLGFRNDIDKLLKISDLAVSSSKQEGLPVNLIEAAFCGLPIVATDCRGNRDVVSVVYSSDEFKDAVIKSQSKTQENCNTNQFSMDDVAKKMSIIYSSELMKFNTPSKNIAVKVLKKIRQKILLAKNKIGSKKRNEAINNKQITIISNNCFAGIAYEHLDLPYNSPTIGLYFFAKDYIKFINNLKSYLKKELVEIKPSESKYYDELVRLGQENVVIGKLDDIEIVFLHYESFSEAKEKWTRRCKRVDFDNIMYTFNDQNLCTENDLKAFHDFKAANKVCFTAKKYEYPEFVQIKKYEKRGIIKDGAFGWYNAFDLTEYIKSRELLA